MDSIPLVATQIEAVPDLLARLVADGVPVAASAWVDESDTDRWYLYVVSPLMDSLGPKGAYGKLVAVLHPVLSPGAEIDLSEIKLVGVTSSVGRALLEIRRTKKEGPIRYRGYRLGELSIDAAYIYPPVESTPEPAARPE